MAFKAHIITRYGYKFDARTGSPGGMQLFDDTKLRASITFVPDAATVPPPTLAADLESATASFRVSALTALVDMLRNESPVTLTINNQAPGFVFLSSGLEPVGVNDELPAGAGYMPP